MSSPQTRHAPQNAAVATTPQRTGILQRKCSCGSHTIAGDQCPECAKKKLQRKANSEQTQGTVPSIVQDVLSSPGQPLDAQTRAFMELRFGQDFSAVRIHTDSRAAESARAVNALAYTVGSNVVFGSGQHSPVSESGRRLMAHELTHVVQQRSSVQLKSGIGEVGDLYERQADAIAEKIVKGQSAENIAAPVITKSSLNGLQRKTVESIQRQPDPNTANQSRAEDRVSKKVKIPPGTTSVQEFRRYAETVIFGRVINLTWTASSTLSEKYLHINKHIGEDINFTFPRSLIESQGTGSDADTAAGQAKDNKDYQALGDDQREQLNEEIDKRYWDSIDAVPGTKIKTGEKGKAAIWNSFKQQVLADKRKIESLPQDIKDVLFAGGPDAPVLTPENYTQVLRIAEKLAALSPDERRDYLARVNASTTSFDVLEKSIDTYIGFLKEREQQAQQNETTARPLFGVEDIYEKYRYYKLFLKNADENSLGEDATEEDKEFVRNLRQSQIDNLVAALKQKDFNSIEAFEASIEAYRVAFRTQAVNLALDVLAHYDHMLFQERNKLQQPGAAEAMVQGIATTQASALYKESSEKSDLASITQMGIDPEDKLNAWRDRDQVRKYRAEADIAHKEAEAEVIRGSGNDPLVAERGTNREKLAGDDAKQMQKDLSDTLNKRAEEVGIARSEFKEDPDRVFKLPDLVSASLQIQGIGSDTIYGKIVSDYIKDENAKHLLSQIAIGILAIALTFLVPGGGWLAAAALVANAGISIHQAYTAYKEYEEQERDYNLHFLSEEPSLVWVGIAVAAAALDLGVAASVVVKESSTALKALKDPLLEFSKLEVASESDLAKLISKIEEADGLKAEVKVALEREAQASLAAKAAVKDLAGKAYCFLPGLPDPGAAIQGFRVLFYSIKRGINTLAKLRADAKFVEAIGDITRMTGVERAELETAFDEVKQLVKVGQAKSMDDASLLGYIDRWAINRGTANFRTKLFEEMKAWKPLTAEQKQALNVVTERKNIVADLYKEKDGLLKERQELLEIQRNPLTRTDEKRQELLEINQRLAELDPNFNGSTVKKIVKARNSDGELVDKIIEVEAPHTPGLIERAEGSLGQAEKEAAQVQVTLYDRLRSAVPTEAARSRTLKGATIDQVGSLKTMPTPLQADHIVSVREISDMEGFANLTWQDQKTIVDMKQNLVAMDGSANASKGDRTWRSWNQASNYYEKSTIDAMIKREADVRATIQAEIKNRLSQSGIIQP